MYFLLALAYQCMACYIPPLMCFSAITYISTSVNNSSSTSVFFRHVYHADQGSDIKYADPARIFLCIRNTAANSSVSL